MLRNHPSGESGYLTQTVDSPRRLSNYTQAEVYRVTESELGKYGRERLLQVQSMRNGQAVRKRGSLRSGGATPRWGGCGEVRILTHCC